MKKIIELLDLSATFLARKGIHNPRRAAEDLLQAALSSSRMDLYLQYDREVSEQELELCRNMLARRSQREPLEYIVQKVHCMGLDLEVTPAVLIPRPETEILIEHISDTLRHEKHPVVWDIGCGSGLIGLALKKRFPQLQVVLTDVSEEACAIAKKNALAHGLDVEVLQGNLFAPLAGRKCDLLVSNPPYIALHECDSLEPEIKNYEPKTAYLAGETGYEIYEQIAQQCFEYMSCGEIWLEIGATQGAKITELFQKQGWSARLFRDYAGHPRFFSLTKQQECLAE